MVACNRSLRDGRAGGHLSTSIPDLKRTMENAIGLKTQGKTYLGYLSHLFGEYLVFKRRRLLGGRVIWLFKKTITKIGFRYRRYINLLKIIPFPKTEVCRR